VRVLHAIHDFLPRHRAGSELYAFHLCRALAARHEVAVLCAEYDPSRAHGEIVRREHEGLRVLELVNRWEFASFAESHRSPLLASRLAGVLDELRPDVLHVHNLLNLSLELPRLARARGIPVLATLHDYTLFCPSGGQRVHVAERHVCERIEPARCARCFGESPFARQMALARRAPGAGLPAPWLRAARALWRRFPRAGAALARRVASSDAVTAPEIAARLVHAAEAIEAIDRFVAPSRALGEEYARLGVPAAKLEVSDYGFPALGGGRGTVRRGPSERLAIGFVGTLVWHKGVHVLLEAAARLPRERFEVLVFGDLATFPDYAASLRRMADGLPVRFLGGFAGEGAARVYAQLDVLVVPSLWPENSPLVIHEAFQAGVPVVGARVGGIPDLLGGGRAGLLYEAGSAAALAECLASLIAEPARLAALAAARPAVKPIERDAAEWEARYAEALRRTGRA
jgi:glycosyltransferase involved in cell wall biosynthesis